MPAEHSRRSSDRVDPDVQLAINQGDEDNRHLLRNEFAEAIVLFRTDLASIRQDVQTGNLADRTEFALLQAKQAEHTSDIADLRRGHENLEPRVRELEAGAVASHEVSDLKRWAIGAAVLPSLSILVGIVLYILEHPH